MSAINLVTLGISIFSIFLSFLTLYFTFFNKVARLVGVLIIHGDSGKKKLDISHDYSLSNTGTVQLVLQEAKIVIGDAKSIATTDRFIEDSKVTNVPCVIDPGHIKIINICFKSKSLSEARNKNQGIFAMFTFYSPKGNEYNVYHEFTAMGAFDTKQEEKIWKPFYLGRPEK